MHILYYLSHNFKLIFCHLKAFSVLIKHICSILQIGIAHHIVSHMDLCTIRHHFWLLHLTFNLWCHTNILLGELLFFPWDLKLSNSWLFNKNMSRQLGDISLSWWILNEVWELFGVCIVNVVSDTEELLSIVVAASQQDGGDTDDVVGW